jgi:hypothetical protein
MNIDKSCVSPLLACMCLVILLGCTNQRTISPSPEIVTRTLPEIVSTPISTSIPVILVTPTLGATPTIMVSATNTPLPSATITPNVTLQPTLDRAAGYQAMTKLLETNGDCKLPCLIGITPGKTLWNETSTLFSSMGMTVPKPFPNVKFGLDSYIYQFWLKNASEIYYFEYFVKENEIKLMVADIGFPVSGNSGIQKTFSLRETLLALGKPTAIYLLPSLFDKNGLGVYQLFIVFSNDDHWIMVEYSGVTINRDSEVRFCPTDLRQGYTGDRATDSVKMYIQSGPQAYSSKDLGELVGGGGKPGGYTFEEITNESLDRFYSKITESTNNVCYSTPSSNVFWLFGAR